MAVKLITDSTCDLPQDVASQWDITVVPCYVHFNEEIYKDGIDLGPDEFYSRLVSSTALPTTAQPSVNDFVQVYRPLLDEGHDVVSIHLSAKFSGTMNSAIQARDSLLSSQERKQGRIEIIDSQMTSMGLGLIVLDTARVIKSNASCDEVLEKVRSCMARTHCYFLLDTLEYLKRGGRIGKASAFLGSLLNIKPILTIKEGEAHPFERSRTRQRGLQRLVEVISGLGPAEQMGILHSTTEEEAEALKQRLGSLVPDGNVIVSRFGPVIGTYLGPGALGVSLISSR